MVKISKNSKKAAKSKKLSGYLHYLHRDDLVNVEMRPNALLLRKKGKLTTDSIFSVRKSFQIQFEGIGTTRATRLMSFLGLGKKVTWKNIGPDILQLILNNNHIKKCTFNKEAVLEDIRKQIEILSFRGFRHLFGYPARGQRTRTNSKTSLKRKAFYGILPKI